MTAAASAMTSVTCDISDNSCSSDGSLFAIMGPMQVSCSCVWKVAATGSDEEEETAGQLSA